MSVADVIAPHRDRDHLPGFVDPEGLAVQASASAMVLVQVTMVGEGVRAGASVIVPIQATMVGEGVRGGAPVIVPIQMAMVGEGI